MKRFALSAALVAAAIMGTTDQAEAGGLGLFSSGSYGSSGSSGGSLGSHGSSGGASSGGSYGSLGDHGSSGGSSGGTSRRRLIFRSAKSSGGSYGSTGSSSGAYGSTGSSGGSYGSSGGSSGGPTPRELRIERRARRAASHGSSGGASHGSSGGSSHGGSSGAPVYTAPAASHGGGSYGYHSATAPVAPYRVATVAPTAPRYVVKAAPERFAYVVVNLPQDATLYLGGNKTTSTGAVRKFKIPVSNTSKAHAYAVRVVLNRNGQNYVAQSTETLEAGKTVSVKVNDVATAQVAAL